MEGDVDARIEGTVGVTQQLAPKPERLGRAHVQGEVVNEHGHVLRQPARGKTNHHGNQHPHHPAHHERVAPCMTDAAVAADRLPAQLADDARVQERDDEERAEESQAEKQAVVHLRSLDRVEGCPVLGAVVLAMVVECAHSVKQRAADQTGQEPHGGHEAPGHGQRDDPLEREDDRAVTLHSDGRESQHRATHRQRLHEQHATAVQLASGAREHAVRAADLALQQLRHVERRDEQVRAGQVAQQVARDRPETRLAPKPPPAPPHHVDDQNVA